MFNDLGIDRTVPIVCDFGDRIGSFVGVYLKKIIRINGNAKRCLDLFPELCAEYTAAV